MALEMSYWKENVSELLKMSNFKQTFCLSEVIQNVINI